MTTGDNQVLRTLSCVHGNKKDVCDICLGKPEAPADNVKATTQKALLIDALEALEALSPFYRRSPIWETAGIFETIDELHRWVDGNDAGAAPVNPKPSAPVSPQLPSGMEDRKAFEKWARHVDAAYNGNYLLGAEHGWFAALQHTEAMQQAVEAAQKEGIK